MGVALVALGAMALALSIWAIARKKIPKLRVWLAFVAGLTVGWGMLAGVASMIADAITAATTTATTLAIGAAVPGALGIVVVAELVHAMHPKKGKPHRWLHPPLAFLGPTLLVSAGGIFATCMGWLHAGAGDVIPQMASFFTTR